VWWSSGFVGFSQPQVKPLPMANAMFASGLWCLVFSFHPCAQFPGTGLLLPYCFCCCACCLYVYVLIWRARVWYSPNWWIRAMVTGIGSMDDGLAHWRLVDDVGAAKLVLCLFQILWHSLVSLRTISGPFSPMTVSVFCSFLFYILLTLEVVWFTGFCCGVILSIINHAFHLILLHVIAA